MCRARPRPGGSALGAALAAGRASPGADTRSGTEAAPRERAQLAQQLQLPQTLLIHLFQGFVSGCSIRPTFVNPTFKNVGVNPSKPT